MMMRLVFAVFLSVLIALTVSARADDSADCYQSADQKRTIKGCTSLIKGKRLNKLKLANAYYNRGSAYDDEGEFDRAIQDYDKAIKLNPKDGWAYNNRGIAYRKKGEFDRALRDYDMAIKLNPKDADIYNNRGIAYAKKGEFDRAITDYDKAIRLDPKDALTYKNRGTAYGIKGEYDRAIADYHVSVVR